MKRLILTIEAPSIDGIGLKGVPAGAEVTVRVEDKAGTHFVSVNAPFTPGAEIPVKRVPFKTHVVSNDPASPYFRLRRWKSEDDLRVHIKHGWRQCNQDVCVATVDDGHWHERRQSPTHLLPCEAKQQGRYRSIEPLLCTSCSTFFSVGGLYEPLRCPDCAKGYLSVITI